MNQAKTNALDALRALIAERQQYEQWISTLESKRDGTPAHVFEKVNADYESRLDRVVGEISGYAEDLQLNITTLSSRLIEVAREEDTSRDTLQEAELRAAVGEYEPGRWEELRVESQRELDRIAGDRERLDNELSELRSIQTLSAFGVRPQRSTPPQPRLREEAAGRDAAPAVTPEEPVATPVTIASNDAPVESKPAPSSSSSGAFVEIPTRGDGAPSEADAVDEPVARPKEKAAVAEPAPPVISPRPKLVKTMPTGAQGKAARPADARAEQSKTLKCPECGTPNHPTEWYCERCGGELATM